MADLTRILLGMALLPAALTVTSTKAATAAAETSGLLVVKSPSIYDGADAQPAEFDYSLPGGASVNSVLGDGHAITYAAATAHAAAGGLHLSAFSHSTATIGQSYAYSNVYSNARVEDQFTLQSPQLPNGTQLMATFAFKVSGQLSGFAQNTEPPSNGMNAQASARWDGGLVVDDLTVPGPYAIGWQGWQQLDVQNGQGNLQGNVAPGSFSFTVPVVLGNLLNVYLYAGLEARSSVSTMARGEDYEPVVNAQGFAEFGNTFAWGGIVSLTDMQGQAITQFSALSTSTGFDYAQAYVASVPEPGMPVLMLAGLAGLWVVGRRSRDLAHPAVRGARLATCVNLAPRRSRTSHNSAASRLGTQHSQAIAG